jgi:hypothetical protein
MSDAAEGKDQQQAHRCQAQAGFALTEGVVCFECFRAVGGGDAAPEEPDPRPESSQRSLEPRRTLTPREIRHRGRMLEWLRRA